jgi:hypothetical protein
LPSAKNGKELPSNRSWEEKEFHLDFFQHDSFVTTHYPLGLQDLSDGIDAPMLDISKQSTTLLWAKFCSAVCNLGEDYLRTGNVHETTLTEAQKLSMVLQVLPSESNHEDHYIYRPTHVIYRENCMLISTHVFDVSSPGEFPKMIHENSYDSRNKHHYKVRHIAFGPRSCPVKRQASIWFDIPDEEIHQGGATTICQPVNAAPRTMSPTTVAVDDLDPLQARASFSDAASNLEKPFLLKLLTHDQEYFQLAMNVLNWRLKSLTQVSSWKEVTMEGKILKGSFQSLLRNWQTMSSWPVNLGREIVTPETPVPLASSQYKLPEDEDSSLTFFSGVWDNFVSQVSEKSETNFKSSRLPVFQSLVDESDTAMKHNLKMKSGQQVR